MKTIIKITLAAFLISASSSLFAVSEEVESNLLAKVMLESATTNEQKTAVGKYFIAIANEKKQEANRYRSMAKLAYGGKVQAQYAQKKEFLAKAKALDAAAKSYSDLAEGIISKEAIAAN